MPRVSAPNSVGNAAAASAGGDDSRSGTPGTAEVPKTGLLYGVEDVPGALTCIMFGLQQSLVVAGGILTGPLVLATEICAGDNNLVKVRLASSMMMIAGLSTFLQTTFGVRLPIIQGPSFAFMAPTIALMSLPEWKCPEVQAASSVEGNLTVTTTADYLRPPQLHQTGNVSGDNLTPPASVDTPGVEAWLTRLAVVQGGLICAAFVQIIVGTTGLMGYLLRFIGPLTIIPTVALIGVSLFDVINGYAGKQWGVAIMTLVFFCIFSMYLGRVQCPVPSCSVRTRSCRLERLPLFALFPYLLTICLTWIICAILTATDAIPNEPGAIGYLARTDLRSAVLRDAPWFRVPYPGQWGAPTFNLAIIIGMMFGTLASIIESIGDYYVTAEVCQEPLPPAHAINRGIAMEGVGCFIGGFIGSGLSVTSYSEQVGTIQVTRVGCRRATQVSGVIFVLLSCLPKVPAGFTSIPDPIIGGMLLVGLGLVTTVGLSNIKFLNMSLPRNALILAVSLMLGLCLPKWLAQNPGAISVGVAEVDQALTVLLGTPMVLGGLTGFVLDNTVPARKVDRGLFHYRHQRADTETSSDRGGDHDGENEDDGYSAYNPPWNCCGLGKMRWSRYVPFLPDPPPRRSRGAQRARNGESKV